jgi:hypothetical protein
VTDVAAVESFERVTDENGEAVIVKVDEVDGPLLEPENFPPCGDDAPPLATDFAAIKEATGRGTTQVVGYQDPKNKGKALGGEKRIYARDPDDGSVVADIWLHGDGTIEITSIKSGSSINLNGVLIDQQGNITAPGDVTAMSASPATSVKLSTHLHPTGTGPSGPPQAGT